MNLTTPAYWSNRSRKWILGMFVAGLIGSGVQGEGASFRAWRTPTNSGVTVLYCYLRVHGIELSYDDLCRERDNLTGTNVETILTLETLAKKHACPLQVFSLNM